MKKPLIHELGQPARETLVGLLAEMRGDQHEPLVTIEHLDLTLSWGEFDDRVRRLATGLKSLGVKPGDRVAAVLDNGAAILEGWFAAMALGAIWVPANTALRGTFLTHVLNDSGAEVLIAESDLIPRVADISADLEYLNHLISVTDRQDSAHDSLSQIEGMRLKDIADLRKSSPLKTFHPAKTSDIAAFIYTSGTTGAAKGCMLSHSYITNVSLAGRNGRKRSEPAFTALPLFHLNAMASFIITLMLGSRITVGARFSVSKFWPSIEKSGAKFVNLLGPMATMLAHAEDNDAMLRCKGQLRKVLAVPFPPDVVQIFKDRFGVAYAGSVGGYGLTELGTVTIGGCEGVTAPPDSSGARNSWIQVELVDDDDNILPVGEVGEVVCRPNYPDLMFSGYWGRPEATVKAFRNLWFHTGDLGRFDEDGFFYFEDRKKDYLRRRGENISSMEVEHVFHQHPDVSEVACYGVSSEVGEDEVQISVVLHANAEISEEDLCLWSVERLPYFAVPRFIEYLAEIPKSAVGRPRKVELRERKIGYSRWDRELSEVEIARR